LRGEAVGNLHLSHLAHGLAVLLVAQEHLCAHGLAADLPAVAFHLQSDPMMDMAGFDVALMQRVVVDRERRELVGDQHVQCAPVVQVSQSYAA